jgi:hypothetical protein
VVGMQTHPGNPYAGQTLAPALIQVERLTGTTPRALLRGPRLSGAPRKQRHRGVRRRPAARDHPHHPARAAAALGDRGDDRPHEARRQARAQPPQGRAGRLPALWRRPQPAPHPAPPAPASLRPTPSARRRPPSRPRRLPLRLESTYSGPTRGVLTQIMSMIRAKWMKAVNMMSSFSKREKIV